MDEAGGMYMLWIVMLVSKCMLMERISAGDGMFGGLICVYLMLW